MMIAATGSLLAGVGLGLTARIARRRGRRRTIPRSFHQAAFVSSCVTLSTVVVRERRRSGPAALANAAALATLATLPRTSGWRPRHVGVAVIALALHGVGYLGRGSLRRS